MFTSESFICPGTATVVIKLKEGQATYVQGPDFCETPLISPAYDQFGFVEDGVSE